MTLDQALTQADSGKQVVYSTNGGLKRYLRFQRYGGIVAYAYAYGHKVVTFTPDGMIVNACGYEHRITTREAISYCIAGPHGGLVMYSDKNKIYVRGVPYVPDMKVDYR